MDQVVKLEQAMNKVKYPEMRKELRSHLQALSDPEYQRRVWVAKGKEGSIQHDELDYAIHFLYDDTQLADDPRSMIGWILYDASEAELMERLVRVIEGIFEQHGTALSDAQYIGLAEWGAVVDAAKEALVAIGE
jgi:hypothetical protein